MGSNPEEQHVFFAPEISEFTCQQKTQDKQIEISKSRLILLMVGCLIIGVIVGSMTDNILTPSGHDPKIRSRSARALDSIERNVDPVSLEVELCNKKNQKLQQKLDKLKGERYSDQKNPTKDVEENEMRLHLEQYKRDANQRNESMKILQAEVQSCKDLRRADQDEQRNQTEALNQLMTQCNETMNVLMKRLEAFTKKCDPGWSYLEGRDSCYYYHNFTYDNDEKMEMYTWHTAEKNCLKMGAHLVSIDIDQGPEMTYIDEMTSAEVRALNPETKTSSACFNSHLGAWIGLNMNDGTGQWTDGTPNVIWKNDTTRLGHFACYDSTNKGTPRYWHNNGTSSYKHSRFICKKSPRST